MAFRSSRCILFVFAIIISLFSAKCESSNDDIVRSQRFLQNYFKPNLVAARNETERCEYGTSSGNCSDSAPVMDERNDYFTWSEASDQDGPSRRLYQPSDSNLRQAAIQINELACTKSNRNPEQFHLDVTVRQQGVYYKPVIEAADIESISADPYCSISQIHDGNFQINFQDLKAAPCGVHRCAHKTQPEILCLLLRFPIIPGVRTTHDLLLRVQCKPQIEFLSHTKQFKLKPTVRDTNGRLLSSHYREISTASVVGASSTSLVDAAETLSQMALYRRGTKSGSAVEAINKNEPVADGTVYLGEEVQLRSVINRNSANAWRYSRLGEVRIQRQTNVKSSGYGTEDLDSVVIISADGCLNPRLKAICPTGQLIDKNNPLNVLMDMRIFMFDGMKDGDEMVMSVTVYACIYYEDCYTPEFVHCINQQLNNPHHRVRKSIQQKNETIDLSSQISFRVQTPKKINFQTEDTDTSVWINLLSVLTAAVSIGILLVIALYITFEKGLLFYKRRVLH